MSRTKVVWYALVIASGALILATCKGGGEEDPVYPINPPPDYYHVSLVVDGQPVTLNYGRISINANEPTVAVSSAGDSIRFDCETAPGYYYSQDVEVSLYGWLSPATPGTYPGIYSTTAGPGNSAGMGFVVTHKGVAHPYQALPGGAVTFNSFEAVNGAASGTIDITFTASDTPSPMFSSPCIVTGEFRVLRAADSLYF